MILIPHPVFFEELDLLGFDKVISQDKRAFVMDGNVKSYLKNEIDNLKLTQGSSSYRE